MQKKHNLDFCPQCGNKLEGIEDFCPECGNKLISEQKDKTSENQPKTPPPIVNETPAPNTAEIETENKVSPPEQQQTPAPKQAAGSSSFPWMKVAIIFIVVAVLGVGGFFIVTKTNLISGGSAVQNDLIVATTSKYFVCYSTASIGGEVKAAVSNIIVATDANQDLEWAKGLFKKSLKSKLGGEHKHFSKVFAKSYTSMDEATKGSQDMRKDYKGKGYQLKTIRIEY